MSELLKLPDSDKLELITEQERIIHEQNILIDSLMNNKEERREHKLHQLVDSQKAVLSLSFIIFSIIEESEKINDNTYELLKELSSDLFNLSFNALTNPEKKVVILYHDLVMGGNFFLEKTVGSDINKYPKLDDYIVLTGDEMKELYQLFKQKYGIL